MHRTLVTVATALALAVVFAAPAAAAAPAPVAHWAFDDGAGTTATDSTGHHPATLVGGAGWTTGIRGPAALQPNGNGFADAGGPVVDTTQSFSVSAWARFDRISGYQTVVSIDGDNVSGFYLQLRGDTGRFAFVRLSSDSTQAAAAFPSATFDPSPNTWYLLTGVYDAAAGTYSLYVDGRLEDTVAAPPAWRANGHMVIGRGKFAGNPVDWVGGAIDDVRVYQQALTPGQVGQIALAGLWRLNEGRGTKTADASLDGHTGTLTGGTSWTAGVVGGRAVAFDGSSGAVDVPAPVIDTSQGFSVAAWVRADSADGFRTAVSVDGTDVSGFFLQRRNDGRFAFTKLASDSRSAAAAIAGSSETARVGQWYHLVGVYDSAASTVTLYVNGVLQQTVSAPAGWRATGHFVIGRGKFAGGPVDWWSGAVDDVRAYPFALDARAAATLASSGLWHFDEGAGTIAHDSSPDAADGTLHHVTWTPGPSGSAVAFDGSGVVGMGDHPALDLGTGPASVAAWFETRGDGAVVSKRGAYSISVSGGHVAARLGAARVQTTDSVYADGDWHHGALVLNRTEQTLRLYVDGEPATIEPTAGSCGTPASATALDVTACDTPADSANAFEVGRGFTGAVDEVEVVRFPLSATQIAKLAAANQLTVDATDLRTNTRSTEFGFMLEDISHSGDGGLYSELVRNRTFKEGWQAGEGSGPVPYWSLVQDGGATGSFAIDTSQPLNAAIDRSLRLHIDSLAPGGRLGAANGGYYGVAVRPSTRYTGSLWAKATPGFTGRLRVSLEKPDGTVLAGTAISGVGGDWARHTYALTTPAGIPTTTDNRIVVTAESPRGTLTGQDVWLSVVSLFPPTYKGHGLRTDIMEKLAAVHPGFFRIPGGNYLEGATVDTRFEFKQTLGPIWERPGHQNTAWGYWSTDGLGLLEYLRMAEDVGAQPLLAVFAGYTLNGRHVSEDDYGRYIQDALDEIEYAIGDTTTTWGARRAADGHPQPFNVHYVEIGNEDWFDQSGSYSWRFTRMYEAIKARYPQLKLIATTGGYQGGAASSTSSGTRPDVVDDHYYQSPAWFDANATRYDTASRSGPQVLVGEYGAIDGTPTGTLRAAVGEASFLTGLERNSDIVIGSTFAPLIVNEHAPNWPTNLIGIDAASSYGSPSYWVQRTFSANTGKTVIGSTLAGAGGLREVVTETRSGRNATFYVKLVNYGASRQTARITFQGVTRIDPTAVETVITGDPLARNTLDAPEAVVPATRDVTGLTTSSRFTLPGYSVTVLRVTGGV